MKLIRSLFDRRALPPAGLLLVLSGIYELGYYGLFALSLPTLWQGLLFILWYLAAGVALYALMAWIWQTCPASAVHKTAPRKKAGHGKKATDPAKTLPRLRFRPADLFRAALLPAVFLVLVYGILRPLYGLAASHPWVLVPVELVCALVLIVSGPLVVTWNLAVARGTNPLQSLAEIFRRRTVLNGWCFLVLTRMALDTLLGGLFTLSYGVNAFSLATLTLFQGDPLSSAALYASAGFSGAALLFCLTGCLLAWMQAGWILHGTD